MSSKFSHHDTTPPREERDDEVWALLNRSQPPLADPMFSRQVMRKIRLESHVVESWWRRCMAPLAVSAATAACGLILGFSLARKAPVAGMDRDQPFQTSEISTASDAPSLAPASPLELSGLVEDDFVFAVAEHAGDYSDLEVMVLLGF